MALATAAAAIAAPARALASPMRGWKVGQPMPDFGYRDESGRRRLLSQGAGQARLVLFWGSWCGPCQSELPRLDVVWRRWREDRRVDAIALTVNEPLARSLAWLKRKELALPGYDPDRIDGWTVKLADGTPAPIGGTPTGFVIDDRGVIRFGRVGGGAPDPYEAAIKQITGRMIRIT
jgi:thiol-disulfide isomerase/thioredoxin